MTVELVFGNGITIATIDKELLPPEGGVAISVSANSPNIDRDGIELLSSGENNIVRIKGVELTELSDETMQAIINTVSANHLTTRER